MNSGKWLAFGCTILLLAGGCGKKDELSESMTESSDGQAGSQEGGSQEDESGTSSESSGQVSDGEKVNINTADAQTLATVPGIGEKMADDIIAYREEHGKFTSVDQLQGAVKRLGEKTFGKMAPYLTVEGGMSHGSVTPAESMDAAEPAASEADEGKSKRPRMAKKALPTGTINLNTASISELQTIPGIGEKKAEEILEYRKTNGPFKAIEDIKKVKGLGGEKKFEKMKPYITVQ